MAFGVGGAINPQLIQALQQQSAPQTVNTGPLRSQLVEQLLRQQQARRPQNIQSVGEGFARLGSDLVSALSGRERINQEVAAAEQAQLQQQEQQSALANALGIQPGLGLSPQEAIAIAAQQRHPSAATEAFNVLTEGLTDEEKIESRRIRLGLSPRAVGASAKTFDVGGVPHVFDPVTQTAVPIAIAGANVTAESVGASEAEIAELRKRGLEKGALASKVIDKGFTSIGKIRTNLFNIDRAISALDKGANTGAVTKFLPSVKAATVELNQIQNELALDIVGATTFGALSAGELALARETALPTGLSPVELKDFLVSKKAAQAKLSDYFQQQIEFLEGGGSVVDFLKQQDQPQQDQSTDFIFQDGKLVANPNRAK